MKATADHRAGVLLADNAVARNETAAERDERMGPVIAAGVGARPRTVPADLPDSDLKRAGAPARAAPEWTAVGRARE